MTSLLSQKNRRQNQLLTRWSNQPGRNWCIEANSAMAAIENISLARDTIAPFVPTAISARSAWTHPKLRPLILHPTKWRRSYRHRRGRLFFSRISFYTPRALLRIMERRNVYVVCSPSMSMHQGLRQGPSTGALHVPTALSAKHVRRT